MAGTVSLSEPTIDPPPPPAPRPPGELKATFGTDLEVLQCSRTFMSEDRSPVTRGRSVAEYPALHGPCPLPPPPLPGPPQALRAPRWCGPGGSTVAEPGLPCSGSRAARLSMACDPAWVLSPAAPHGNVGFSQPPPPPPQKG